MGRGKTGCTSGREISTMKSGLSPYVAPRGPDLARPRSRPAGMLTGRKAWSRHGPSLAHRAAPRRSPARMVVGSWIPSLEGYVPPSHGPARASVPF